MPVDGAQRVDPLLIPDDRRRPFALYRDVIRPNTQPTAL